MVFDEFAQSELLPANEIEKDKNRILLDQAFVRRVLKLQNWQTVLKSLELVRRKLAAEPSIAGQKVDKTAASNVMSNMTIANDAGKQKTPQVEFAF